VIQRSAVISGQQLAKGPRMDFANDLQQAMPVGNGQHRCHTIAYGTICAGVIDPINACLNAGRDVALGALDGLIRAVYPNGATAGHHVGSVALAGIANQYHTAAVAAANAIANHIAALPQLNLQGIVTEANNLIHALNNSPDNLRVGNGSTNSSIQEGLDLEPIGTSPLPNGAVVVNEDRQQVNPQPPPGMTVIRVRREHEIQLHTLFTRTYSVGGMVHLFSSGRRLQSSSYNSMTSSTMTNHNATPVAVEYPVGSNRIRLFDVV